MVSERCRGFLCAVVGRFAKPSRADSRDTHRVQWSNITGSDAQSGHCTVASPCNKAYAGINMNLCSFAHRHAAQAYALNS